MLMRRKNERTGKVEYALVSRSNPSKVLQWFGPKKPSNERVAKVERRVQYFKHAKG